MTTPTRKTPPVAEALSVSGGLSLDRKGQTLLAGRRIALLEGIETLGSISQAAKAVGLSYKGAWDMVDTINNVAGKPVVLRETGGQHGGGSRLTEHGRQLVQLYRQLESGQQRVLARLQAAGHDRERLDTLLQALTLRTSARNQFRGRVKVVRRGAVNADVTLDLGDGLEIFANITNGAVDDLGLKRGREAFALIKASFVLLAPDAGIRISARNRLPGTVKSIVTGAVNCEVRLRLAGDRTLVAIVTRDGLAELELQEGSACCGVIKASHVLIAVND
jgi:molybdate transport system regulatory protein